MNGKWVELKDELLAMATTVTSSLAAIGISFYFLLLSSDMILKIPQNFEGISRKQVLDDYDRLVRYLISDSKKEFIFEHLATSPQASQHFADVHRIVQIGGRMTLCLLVLAVLLFCYEKKRYQLWRLIPLFKQILLLIVIMVGLFLISFPDSFLWLHEIVFTNHNWVFNSKTDPIILLLDEHFFIKYLMIWLLTVVILITIIIDVTKNLIKLFVRRR
ncbi:TIGR01906 family membrane protein [uncultured Limosilactobacillus sp.]|uniref:TIGR01906 family membrane protein n=1 Tax=uncultured Limosilactobacillus sp. TaxID=2837629 RepID=UPI0025D675F1|nr:TIGR01906 family membrane protein [uncultured Limosilactobacillus sp.]